MNLILLFPEDHLENDTWVVSGRRFTHIRDILRIQEGGQFRAGVLNGQQGIATLDTIQHDSARIRFTPLCAPPPALPLTLILALPRPKMLKRILSDVASLGVKDIVLLNSYKVDKSYWATPELKGELLAHKLIQGLEQAVDTRLPAITLAPRFKPFIEDDLATFAEGKNCLIAHPQATGAAPHSLTTPTVLAIGPEGGWTDYEFECFRNAGFDSIQCGQRILRVETAVPALIGRIMHLP